MWSQPIVGCGYNREQRWASARTRWAVFLEATMVE